MRPSPTTPALPIQPAPLGPLFDRPPAPVRVLFVVPLAPGVRPPGDGHQHERRELAEAGREVMAPLTLPTRRKR